MERIAGADACTKPRLALEDRPCWTCGKKHLSKDCPDNPRNKAKGIRNVVEPVGDDFFLVHEKPRPSPKTIRISDFRPAQPAVKTRNTFDVLETKAMEVLM